MLIPDKILWAADRLKAGRRVNRITVRDFLGHFGAERRGSIKVQAIREILDALDLTTEPDFELAWIDEPIWLRLKDGARTTAASSIITEGSTADIELEGASATLPQVSDLAEPPLTSTAPDTPTRSEIVDGISAEDPTFRIGSLPAANKHLIVISNDAPLTKAITLMLQYDFSQLPVMQGERDVNRSRNSGLRPWFTLRSLWTTINYDQQGLEIRSLEKVAAEPATRPHRYDV